MRNRASGCGVRGTWLNTQSGQTFVEVDQEFVSTVISPLPLIQEGQLSVTV